MNYFHQKNIDLLKKHNLSNQIEKLQNSIIEKDHSNLYSDQFIRYVSKNGELKGGKIHNKDLEAGTIKLCNRQDKNKPIYWTVQLKDIKVFRDITVNDKYKAALQIINELRNK